MVKRPRDFPVMRAIRRRDRWSIDQENADESGAAGVFDGEDCAWRGSGGGFLAIESRVEVEHSIGNENHGSVFGSRGKNFHFIWLHSIFSYGIGVELQ